jgi:hypothetical protein
MIENSNPEDPIILESLKSIINDIPWVQLREFIEDIKPLRRQFHKGGFRSVSKHKDRAVDTIINDCKGNYYKYSEGLFFKWLEAKKEYLSIFNEFLRCLSSDEETKKYQCSDNEFKQLCAILPTKPAKYFLYFSPKHFSEDQGKCLLDLSEEISPKKVELLREMVFKKNKEIQELESEMMELEKKENEKSQENIEIEDHKKEKRKLLEENNELKWRLKRIENKEKQYAEEVDNERKKIKKLEQQLEPLKNTLENQAKEIELLNDQNKRLSIKEKELEKIKEEGLKDFLETKKHEIKNQMSEIQEQMEQKKSELVNILSRIEEEKQHLDSLEEFNQQKRKELLAYVEKGEKWKRALYPTIPDKKIQPVKPDLLTSMRFDEQKVIIEKSSELEICLENSSISSDEMIHFRQTRRQLSIKRIFQVEDMKEISHIESFFGHLGHENGCFVLNADAAWLTPKSLWESKGYLRGCNIPLTLIEVMQWALKESDMIFQVEILGADRAPVEGYLAPLIKAIGKKEKIIIKNMVMEIPLNLFFFLQFDNDEYCAKRSNWITEMISTIKVIPLDSLSKKIFVPTDILLKEKK